VQRIAAEGRLPLPRGAADEDDEFASPRKRRASSINLADVRSSAASEAEIEELTGRWLCERQRAERALQMVEFLQAECELKVCSCAKKLKRRLSAAADMPSPRRRRSTALKITDAGDAAILSEIMPAVAVQKEEQPTPRRSKTEMLREIAAARQDNKEARQSTVFVPAEGIFRTVSQAQIDMEMQVAAEPKHEPEVAEAVAPAASEEKAANSTSEQTTLEEEQEVQQEPEPERKPEPEQDQQVPSPSSEGGVEEVREQNVTNPPCYARTPSVEPPSFAVLTTQQRTSLLSLLDAPHQHELLAHYQAVSTVVAFNVPTIPGPAPEDIPAPASVPCSVTTPPVEEVQDEETVLIHTTVTQSEHDQANDLDLVDSVPESRSNSRSSERTQLRDDDRYGIPDVDRDGGVTITSSVTPRPASVLLPPIELIPQDHHHNHHLDKENVDPIPPPYKRPHTSAACYAGVKTVTTTTKVPHREETTDPSLATRLLALQRTPSSHGSRGGGAEDGPSFDPSNPALTPTMTREQALAQIRARRGRARSVEKGAATPRKQMVQGVVRRDMSAPTGAAAGAGKGGVGSVGRRVRS
jgi:hypothetical protein